MSSYADIADVKATISIAGADTFLDNDLERAISAASEGLDDELGRSFGQSEDANDIRTYEPGISYRTGELEIDDLIVLTSLRVKTDSQADWETWTRDTDFRLEPLNAPALGKPWEIIRALPDSKRFPENRFGLIEVTGQFGWSDVPSRIIEATGIIASQLLLRKRQAPFGVIIAGQDVGAVAYIARRDPQVAALLRGFYRRSPARSVQLS